MGRSGDSGAVQGALQGTYCFSPSSLAQSLTSQDWNPTVKALIDAAPYIRLFPNYAGSALETWSFDSRVTLVGDAAHTHGGAFAAGGSLAINDAHALYLSLQHVWPAAPGQTSKPSREQVAAVFKLYEATRQPVVNRLLGVVHNSLAGQKVVLERGKTETDGELRRRVNGRMDPWWISEHDVERAFREAVDGAREEGLKEDRSRL